MADFKKIDLLQEKSELVQEVLERKPSWIILWGSTILFLSLIVIAVITHIIEYPEIIRAKITLTNINPPLPIMAKSSGHLELLVKDGEQVNARQYVGIIKSSVNLVEVEQLRKYLNGNVNQLLDSVNLEQLNSLKDLGTLQSGFNSLTESLRQFKFYNNYNPSVRELASLKAQLRDYYNLDQALATKLATAKRKYDLVLIDYNREKALFDESVVAAKDLEIKEAALLEAQAELETMNIQKNQNYVSVSEIKTRSIQVSNNQAETTSQLRAAVIETFKRLTAEFAQWEDVYVLRAPVDGKVSFHSFWQSGQFVSLGTEVMVIVPEVRSEIIGKAESPIYNSGRLKIGQRVNILLESYPFEEYGVIFGKVKAISEVPRKNVYLLEISLDNGMVTSYNKQLVFKQEMAGTAEVVTDDVTLLQRIFNQLYKNFRHQ